MELGPDELDQLRRLVSDINADGAAVAVEGKRDEQALRSVGVTCEIERFHSYGGPAAFADAMARRGAVILLFDGDRKGRALASQAIGLLERRARVDTSYKRRLLRITGIRYVEELERYGPLA